MTGAHRRTDQDSARSVVKPVRWLLLLVGLFVAGLAIAGIPADLLTTNSTFWLNAALVLQGLAMVMSATRLALNVLRNRSPSAVVLANWIGDSALVIVWAGLWLEIIGQDQGWMRGPFEYATSSILGLFVVGNLVYSFNGKRRVVLALTARADAGRWPWSVGG